MNKTDKASRIKLPWMPDFSDPVRIFSVIVVAEIMVIVYSLSFLSFDFAYLNRLAVLSLLAQLIAINVIVLLSSLRQFFNRFSVLIGLVLVVLMTLVLSVVYTQLITWMDQTLNFGLIEKPVLTTVKISLATNFTLLTLLRYFYVQAQWENQIEALSKAQMNALQARIKPHFLYNSLNSIASLISFDPVAAERAVINLSGLFRKAFTDNKKSMSTIAKELEWVEEYIAMEKLRLMDRLQFSAQVDEDLLDRTIPLLSIQPLIENAVIHGIQNLSKGGLIELTIQSNAGGFYVQVNNPYKPEKRQQGNGTGLANIKERLTLTYGKDVSLSIDEGDDFQVRWEVIK
ncbi:sensor histidine kinase [Marinicella litoralis]|uniref:Two-component system sensor histidine kinase AlgZ n=1 Tax=Marinicella litoralis TaxID=644220 RepID=A0A4R6XVP5_9GAMM|nr:histidine kinase [Marinicella litoralis]TDR20538.1 two-component system sensor histidine kinase AlgZ [Marinicella litoralis]